LVEHIKDGMVLDKDVCGPSGNVLLGKGTPVGASMGRRLKNWGILQISVEGQEEGQQSGAAPQISPQEIRAGLEKKFSGCLDHPVMKKIFNAIYQYKIQKS
jgi:hypothetical protein